MSGQVCSRWNLQRLNIREPPWADFLADGIALFGTSVNQPVISDAFLVQQSNIYVTLVSSLNML